MYFFRTLKFWAWALMKGLTNKRLSKPFHGESGILSVREVRHISKHLFDLKKQGQWKRYK